MPRVGGNLTRRFKYVGSCTPLYHGVDAKFYWNHCWYCGCELVYDRHDPNKKPNSFTRDHVYPASLGGGKGTNTVPACFTCNGRKDNRTLEEFRIVYFGNNKDRFFGEKREAELVSKFKNKEIRPTMQAQLAMILQAPPKPNFKPRPDRRLIYKEQFVATPLSRILRLLFKAF